MLEIQMNIFFNLSSSDQCSAKAQSRQVDKLLKFSNKLYFYSEYESISSCKVKHS